MEISLRPPLHGCLIALLNLMTLGLYPLLRRWGERHFIRRMDDEGFETRGGKRIPWSEVTAIQRRQGVVNGAVLSDEMIVETRRGRASLPVWRMGNAEEGLDYLLRRLPAAVGR
jgi:hypothetical protein